MKAKTVTTDVGVYRKATARMREINLEVQAAIKAEDSERVDALRAEYAELDGSWQVEAEVDLPGVISEAEGIKRDVEAAKEAERQSIRDELAANDAKAMRALFAGETDKIAEHNARQDALRKKLAEI